MKPLNQKSTMLEKKKNWLDDELKCPLLNTQLCLDIVVIVNHKHGDKKQFVSNHGHHLVNQYNITFDEEPAKVWLLYCSMIYGCLTKVHQGNQNHYMLLEPMKKQKK